MSSEIRTRDTPENPAPGIYGFALTLEYPDAAIAARLTSAPAHWPVLHVRRSVERVPLGSPDPAATPTTEVEMDEHLARVTLPDGTATMHRDSREAWFRTSAALSSDEMVHPMLGYAALAFANWMGREAFHAGVFLSGKRAWALLGERGSGKSSTLGWLACNGTPIVADDLLFLDGRTAFVGPRTIDLASATASHLGLAEGLDLEQVRQGFRLRLALDPLAPEHQLAGWVSLAWGEELQMASVPPAGRIPLLIEHGHQPRGEANWSSILALASLPTFQLTRPRELHSLASAGELLLAATAAAS